jgi:hypothetical protein
MDRITPGSRAACLVALLVLASAGLASRAVFAQAPKFVARFTTTTVGLNPGNNIGLKIDVLRWSTDEEAATLSEAFTKDATKWNEALQAAPSVGYIWSSSSSLGYSIKLARQVASPDGSARIVLAIDRALGSWERGGWKGVGPAASDYPFSVVELRVIRRGTGEGKTSLAGNVAMDQALKAPALEAYATAPVTLKTVARTE